MVVYGFVVAQNHKKQIVPEEHLSISLCTLSKYLYILYMNIVKT